MTLLRGLLSRVVVLLTVVAAATGCSRAAEPSDALPEAPQESATPTSELEASTPEGAECATPAAIPPDVIHYGYQVVNAYPHDTRAFTEGLVFQDGVLYEGTGLVGRSSLRRVQLETGDVVASIPLPYRWFGEGIVAYGNTIVQLTWKDGVGLVYDREDFSLLREFTYDTEGWGITYDGQRLIMSDGTSTLRFLDPHSFEVWGSVDVRDRGAALVRLNELEFIDGLVYANVWQTDRIAIIDPSDGRVTGWIDLSGLLSSMPTTRHVDVLNGIAYDAEGDRLFVTGKLWPWLYEIRLVPES